MKPEVKPLNPRISPRLDVFMSATDQVNRSRAEQCPSLAVPSEGDGRPGVEAGAAAVDYADPTQTAQVALEAIRQARSPTEPVARVAVVKVMSRKDVAERVSERDRDPEPSADVRMSLFIKLDRDLDPARRQAVERSVEDRARGSAGSWTPRQWRWRHPTSRTSSTRTPSPTSSPGSRSGSPTPRSAARTPRNPVQVAPCRPHVVGIATAGACSWGSSTLGDSTSPIPTSSRRGARAGRRSGTRVGPRDHRPTVPNPGRASPTAARSDASTWMSRSPLLAVAGWPRRSWSRSRRWSHDRTAPTWHPSPRATAGSRGRRTSPACW